MTKDFARPAGGDQVDAGHASEAPPVRSRVAATAALTISLATVALSFVFTVEHPLNVLASLACGTLGISAWWIAATNRRFRWPALGLAVLLTGGVIGSLVWAGRGALVLLVVVVGIAAATALGSLALRWEVHNAIALRWRQVAATRQGVLFINPKSGDGKPERLHLVDEARRRGVEPVVLRPGDNLRALAESAAERGADALGMAGGDGSQAEVAAVASQRNLSFICIPAGTRNHLALDLGIDRRHVVEALEAFGPARETTIDLAEVNGKVFVNNVSLGVYARIVASDEYREAKRRTVANMLPELLGPGAAIPGLTVETPAGQIDDARVIQVSNDPYTLSSLAGFGSRSSLSEGVLGVAVLSINDPIDVNRLVALEATGHPERFDGWHEWTAGRLVVTGPPSVELAVDGEAYEWKPPLCFSTRPGALRVRIAPGEPGASPAFLHAPLRASTLLGLARVVRGKPSGITSRGRLTA